MKTNFALFLSLFFICQLVSASSAEDSLNEFYKKIRCLTCQGQSIYDSNSFFSENLKKYIKEQYRNGKTLEEIRLDLIEKYGNDIASQPTGVSGIILNSLPYFLLILGLLLTYRFYKQSCN